MIVRSSIALLVFVVVLAAAAAALLLSSTGTRLLVGWAEDLLAPALQVDGLHGNLLSEVCAERVQFSHERAEVLLTEVCVDPNLWASADFLKISLARLEAHQVAVDLQLPEQPAEPDSDFQLPLRIEIDEARLAQLRVDSLEVDGLIVSGARGDRVERICADRVSDRRPAAELLAMDVCTSVSRWDLDPATRLSLASLEIADLALDTGEAEASTQDATPPSLPLELEIDRASVARLRVDAVRLSELATSMALSDRDLRSDSRFVWDGRPVELSSAGPWAALELSARAAGVGITVTTDLTVATLPYSLTAVTDRLDLEPFVGRALRLESGRLSASGDTDGYQFEVATVVIDELGSTQVNGSARGDFGGLDVTALQLSAGRVPGLDLELASLRAAGRIDWRDGWQVQLIDVEAAGSFRSAPLLASVQAVAVDPVATRLEGVLLRHADLGGELTAGGEIRHAGEVALTLAASGLPLALLDDRFDGRLDGQLSMDGPMSDPGLTARYEVAGAALNDYSLQRLQGSLSGDRQRGSVAFEGEHELGAVSGELDYRVDGQVVEVRVNAAAADFRAVPTGSFSAVLAEPLTIGWSGGAISSSDACLLLSRPDEGFESARLCGSVRYPDGPVQLRLEPWTVPPVAIQGERVALSGRAAATLDLAELQPLRGSMTMDLSELRAHHAEVAPLNLGSLKATVVFDDGMARAEVVTPPNQELVLDGRLDSTLAQPFVESSLAGSLLFELDGLWAAETLLPMDLTYELDAMRGRMRVEGQVAGTVAAPLINGTLALRDVGWNVIALNADFSDVNLGAELLASERLEFTGAGQIGSGSVALRGDLSGLDGDEPLLSAAFELDRAEVADLPDYYVKLSGNLSLDMDSRRLAVTGDLEVPTATFRIADLPETAVTVSRDQVLVDDVDGGGQLQQVRSADLNILLGDDVQLEAFGLTARLVGRLRLREAPGKPRELTGNISLREATFEAYGQSLTVERGELSFTGPIDDPAVDVVATRIVSYENRDYRISLLITGTAQSLTTTVRSSPSLPEDDALALLITGRTFSQITSSEQSNVYGAAISLGLLGASGITQNMASTLGLEEIILDQDAEGNMEVGAALRLNRDLYLRYTYGVFSRLGGVLLRYRLTSRFSVQAKTGDAHSIEIRYGVDD